MRARVAAVLVAVTLLGGTTVPVHDEGDWPDLPTDVSTATRKQYLVFGVRLRAL